ncbi:hypothetical protein [Paraburkholderia mimosarum]|uniref:hypothetical protein n=1 Tax=Paraburkholderia mimosarum TaxID=312026 RepID=UPI000485D420|nr:hypothetical protein [Paraburkholderia mimosarum]
MIGKNVDKATATEWIHRDLGRNPKVATVCLAIVDFVSAEGHSFVERLTFGTLSKVAGLDDVAEVLPAVQYLTSARVRLLEPKFEFVDADSGSIEQIEPEVVARARREHVFYHPDRGEPVEDFEKHLFLYFCLTKEGADLAGVHN